MTKLNIVAIQELLQFALLHFALIILLHFALILLHVVLVLHFAVIVTTFCVSITFCGDYYILRRNNREERLDFFLLNPDLTLIAVGQGK